MSDFWSEPSSSSLLPVCEERGLWRDYAGAQSRLSHGLRGLHMGLDVRFLVSKGDFLIPPGVQHADMGHNNSTMQKQTSVRGIFVSYWVYNTLT